MDRKFPYKSSCSQYYSTRQIYLVVIANLSLLLLKAFCKSLLERKPGDSFVVWFFWGCEDYHSWSQLGDLSDLLWVKKNNFPSVFLNSMLLRLVSQFETEGIPRLELAIAQGFCNISIADEDFLERVWPRKILRLAREIGHNQIAF